jgi:serine/threonine-protein kinase
MVWQAGQQLQGGKFEILEVLGRGGFGITYRARHRDLAAEVVIKTPDMLQKRDVEYEQYVQKFQAEGRKLAKFSVTPHPHIVRVWDFFWEGQVPCLVMDFIQGQTLMEKVKVEGRLPEADCLRYIRQIGDALAAVHRAGIIHRDAHPGNIIIQPSGYAVLIDFGIAKDIIPASSSSTDHGFNPSFAPYEQIYGGNRLNRQPSLDIYALAATFYYAVTGERPTPAMERRLDNRPLTPPNKINRQLSENISQGILWGMALEKGDRPQSMQDWLQQFDPPRPPPVPPEYRKKKRKILWSWFAGAFISYGILGYFLASSSPPWWALALAWAGGLAGAVAGVFVAYRALAFVGAFVGAVAGAVAVAVAVAWAGASDWVFARASAWLLAGAGALPLPLAGALTGAVAGAVAWALALASAEALPWALALPWAWALALPLVLALVLALALAWAGAWAGALPGALAVPWAFVGAVAGAGAVAGTVAWFLIESEGEFSKFHSFLISTGTTLGGLGFGWLLEFVLKGYFK